MGQLYSHLVFRPPSVVSYQSTNGQICYVMSDSEGLPRVHKTRLIWLVTELNVRIPCVWIRQPHPDFVILYAHQNGEDLGSSVCDAHLLSNCLNVDVFAFEYSGYGLSERSKKKKIFGEGKRDPTLEVVPSLLEGDRQRVEPSERACCSDIDAAYVYLTNQCHVDPAKIIVFGRSIGSGPAVHCASTKKVAGLVLIAPIASAVRVPLKHLNVTLPFIDTFPNIDRATKIHCPVLVVHGDMDDLVPKIHGEKLFEKFKQNGNAVKPLWIPEASHNNVVEDFHSIVFGRYIQFLEELKQFSREATSIDVRPISTPAYNHQYQKRQRIWPISHSLIPCVRRMSLDHYSMCAHVGDDDRRSRDIRKRPCIDDVDTIFSCPEDLQSRPSSFKPRKQHLYCFSFRTIYTLRKA